jgi:chromosome segregation ATPase
MIMFLILGVVLISAIAVIGGLVFLMKKESEKGPDKAVVPITDISELKRQMTTEARPSAAGDELSEAKAKLAALEKDKPVEPAPALGEIKFSRILTDEPQPAADAATAERVRELEAEVQAISEKAIRQAEDAVKVIEALTRENEALKGAQPSITAGVPDGDVQKLILELKEKNNILENQMDLGSSKITQLETQLAVIRKEMGQQLIEANATIARLKAESETQGRVSQDSILAEKKEIDEWREKTSVQLRDMEETLAKAREENLLLKDAKKLLEAKISVLEDDFKKQLDDAKAIVHTLTGEKETTQQRTTELEQNLEKLKELNATLIDKAKILQFELNRQRAQATGMERVCTNFKSQLEELFETVEKTKKDNERLLAERVNLENGFASLKSENSRLVEKDREYQMELQKTKEQMNRFSKIYDNFKSNLKDVSDDDQN